MATTRPVLTVVLAALICGLSLYLEVKDGGNIDFYWKPAILVWLAVVVAAFFTRRRTASARICMHWWLQLVVPPALFLVAVLLVHIHTPFPLS